MIMITNIYKIIRNYIYHHIEIFMIIFSFLSFMGEWSLISIAFFIWNFFNRKAYLKSSFIFFTIAVLINILHIVTLPWSDKVQREWERQGYDENFKEFTQSNLNILARQIEEFKLRKGFYPVALERLSEMEDKLIFCTDLSYRMKREDGQVDGVLFFYEKINNDKFYLSAIGKDGIGMTEDDIIPEIFHYEEKNTGLTRYKLRPITRRDNEHGFYDTVKKINPPCNQVDGLVY